MEGTEQDINNFSTSSSHRLPTISVTEALEKAAKTARAIPTTLPSLDESLKSVDSAFRHGGIQHGQLTEIYGPPGVGKTTFALQLAVNTIQAHDEPSHVVWIDTGSPLVPRRFRAMMAAYKFPDGHEPPSSPPEPRSRKQLLEKIFYFSAQTLPRLLTLFLHPTAIFPPPGTGLIVVDGLSALISNSFPKSSKPKNAAGSQNGPHEKLAKRAANRKWTIVAELAAAMANMATVKGLAIVVLNQTATSVKGERKAVLKSALGARGWDAAVRTRILLYRDFPQGDMQSQKETRFLRFAQATKNVGNEVAALRSVAFVIERGGLKEINGKISEAVTEHDASSFGPDDLPAVEVSVSPKGRATKRKVEEIADSEDERDGGIESEDEIGR